MSTVLPTLGQTSFMTIIDIEWKNINDGLFGYLGPEQRFGP